MLARMGKRVPSTGGDGDIEPLNGRLDESTSVIPVTVQAKEQTPRKGMGLLRRFACE